MAPPLFQKASIFYQFGSSLSKKVGFFLLFEPILQAGFIGNILALSNKKSSFVLVPGCFGCCSLIILPKYYLIGSFFTKKAH